MPRAAWVSIGAVAAAWLVPAVGPAVWAALAALSLAIALALRATSRHARSVMIVAVAIGFIAIGFRVVLSGAGNPAVEPPLPTDRGPWTLRVEAVGSPRDGQQTATLVGESATAAEVRVAATLPAYPVLVPGDTVTVEGSIRPPPDSPYGAYLRRIEAAGTLRAIAMTITPAADGGANGGQILERWRRGAGRGILARGRTGGRAAPTRARSGAWPVRRWAPQARWVVDEDLRARRARCA